ncbi:MAG TPA: hypothetical protein VJV78_32370 [Polyangiales bacterium]|nr:hypothetical protein [Polyangiales bacterium]
MLGPLGLAIAVAVYVNATSDLTSAEKMLLRLKAELEASTSSNVRVRKQTGEVVDLTPAAAAQLPPAQTVDDTVEYITVARSLGASRALTNIAAILSAQENSIEHAAKADSEFTRLCRLAHIMYSWDGDAFIRVVLPVGRYHYAFVPQRNLLEYLERLNFRGIAYEPPKQDELYDSVDSCVDRLSANASSARERRKGSAIAGVAALAGIPLLALGLYRWGVWLVTGRWRAPR